MLHNCRTILRAFGSLQTPTTEEIHLCCSEGRSVLIRSYKVSYLPFICLVWLSWAIEGNNLPAQVRFSIKKCISNSFAIAGTFTVIRYNPVRNTTRIRLRILVQYIYFVLQSFQTTFIEHFAWKKRFSAGLIHQILSSECSCFSKSRGATGMHFLLCIGGLWQLLVRLMWVFFYAKSEFMLNLSNNYHQTLLQ